MSERQEHEPPLVVMGRLREAVNITGYGLNRVEQEYRYLLQENRWLDCGYATFDEFVSKLQFGSLKMSVEKRREIEALTKAAGEVSNRKLAGMLGVSHTTVQRDLSVGTSVPLASDESVEIEGEIVAGGTSVPLAKPQAFTLDHDQVSKLVQGTARRAESADRREQRLAEISTANAALATEIRYPIIYADPPWRYENPPIGASNRSIENHYPTMTLDEICALPVKDLAWDDALLYLWATAPKLAECMRVVDAWGFEYRTNLVWDKEIIGMGYHARNQHEILLVAKRGEIPPPPAGKQPSSVYRERRGEHSAKPVFFYEMIEAAYPQLRKIELFQRTARPGWDGWGNQASEITDAA